MTAATAIEIPAIGQPWAGQGGIYIGARIKDGQVHHVLIPGGTDFDIKASHNNAAERIAEKGEINGFSDWRHGDQEDLMLAYINAPDQFHRAGYDSCQVSATPYGSDYAWVVAFEDGLVTTFTRGLEFRVRPFRSIIHSTI
jgi:hypothetical protein